MSIVHKLDQFSYSEKTVSHLQSKVFKWVQHCKKTKKSLAVPFHQKNGFEKNKWIKKLAILISEWVDSDHLLWFRCGFFLGRGLPMITHMYFKKSSLADKWIELIYMVYRIKGSINFPVYWLSWLQYTDKEKSFFDLLEYNNIENIFLLTPQKLYIPSYRFPLIIVAEWLALASKNHSICQKIQEIADSHVQTMIDRGYESLFELFYIRALYALLIEFDASVVFHSPYLRGYKELSHKLTGCELFGELVLYRLDKYLAV